MNIQVLLICFSFVCSTASHVFTNDDQDDGVEVFDRRTMYSSWKASRVRRTGDMTPGGGNANGRLTKNYYIFPMDSNNVAFVFWKHAKTNIIFILTCQDANTRNYNKLSNKGCTSKSNLYISENHGIDFVRKNETFIDDHIHSIFLSPVDRSFIILTDYKNKSIHISKDEGKNFKKHTLLFSPTYIHFHPSLMNHIAAYDNTPTGESSLYVSENAGVSWTLISRRVRSYFWAQPIYDSDPTLLRYESSSGKQIEENVISSLLKASSSPYNVSELIYDQHLMPFSVFVGNEFTLVRRWYDKKLYLSKAIGQRGRMPFLPVTFDEMKKPDVHYTVLNFKFNELLLGVLHGDKTASLYLSNHDGVKFMFLQDDIITEEITRDGLTPKIDFYQVKGLISTYIVNKAKVGTLISFDKGYTWNPLNYSHPNQDKCSGRCQLVLYIRIEHRVSDYTAPLMTKASAPGVILAQGYIGDIEAINRDFLLRHQVYVSTDGGRHWIQRLDSSYGYAILDHGSLLAATQLKFTVDHSIKFSLDFGITWSIAPLTKFYCRIAAIITESTAKSLIVNIFGFLQDQPLDSNVNGNTWIVWRYNFSEALPRKCANADYDTYQHSGSCVLGETVSNQRKKPNSKCFLGTEFNNGLKRSPCKCTYADFECDSLHNTVNVSAPPSYKCVPINDKHTSDRSSCKISHHYYRSKGYKKKYGNKCQKGVESILQPVLEECPDLPVTFLRIKAKPQVQSVAAPIDFTLEQDEGVHTTIYTWNFNDGRKVIKGSFSDVKKVSRTFYKHGIYNVTVHASSTNSQSTASVIVTVLDDVIMNAQISFVPPVVANIPTTFSLVVMQKDGSHRKLNYDPSALYVWSFAGVFVRESYKSSAVYSFARPGTYRVEAIVLSNFNHIPAVEDVTVFHDAVIFNVLFSSTLDFHNQMTEYWMMNFKRIVRNYFAAKYYFKDYENRLYIKGKPGLPTTVQVVISDTVETANTVDNNAMHLAVQMMKDINKNTPLLHGYEQQDVHVRRAFSRRFLTIERKKTTKGTAWVSIFVTLIVVLFLVAVAIGFYQYRRKGTFKFWKKNDGMEKKLFSDVDDDCAMDDVTNEPNGNCD